MGVSIEQNKDFITLTLVSYHTRTTLVPHLYLSGKNFDILEQRQNENPSPVEYAMVRFGDRISVHVPSASFASTTQRFKARLFD